MTSRPALAYAPRGLSRTEAARYVGVSASKFDELVKAGRMPSPRRIDARKVWDRGELDIAFDNLPSDDAAIGSGWGDWASGENAA